MATDYDAPRRNEADELAEDSLEELKARRNEAQSAAVDVDETDTAESFELPEFRIGKAGNGEMEKKGNREQGTGNRASRGVPVPGSPFPVPVCPSPVPRRPSPVISPFSPPR